MKNYNKPLIAVLPLVDKDRDSFWMLPGYFDGVTEAGGLPVMLSLTSDPSDIKEIAETFDGFIFTGGPDVAPEIYGEEIQVDNLETCPERDAMEVPLLKEVVELDKPVLGICRGLQFINAVLGGTLYQDLPTQKEPGSEIKIKHSQEAPYDKPCHEVHLFKDASLYKLLSKHELLSGEDGVSLKVNSCHHQGIKKLAPGLRPMAQSPDNLIEAFEMPDKEFIWAVQWHPEFMQKVDEASNRIFEEFIEHCKRA